MKKNYLARTAASAGLASLALIAPAMAQSSITLFGVVDAAVSGFRNKSEDLNQPTLLNPRYVNRGRVSVSRRELRHSGTTTSRLGFRGTEDLGGGLAASFWLEAPITNDDGNPTGLAFVRRSTVSLSGPFGEFRLGRDYTPTFWNDSVFDPWAQIGGGANLMLASGTTSPGNGFIANPNYARASNGVGYFLPPSLGGIYGQVMYTFHENVSYDPGTLTPPGVNAAGIVNPGTVATTRAGRYVGGRLGYANGPVDVAIAYGENTLADNFYAGTTDVVKLANLGASYNFGFAKLSADISRTNYSRDYAVSPLVKVPEVDVSAYLVGLTVPVGVGLIRAAYSHVKYDRNTPALAPFSGDAKASKIALGYVHNLSKRSALYVNLARVSNKNGAGLVVNGAPSFISNATFTPSTSTGYDVGLRHTF